jgi:restriction system protein
MARRRGVWAELQRERQRRERARKAAIRAGQQAQRDQEKRRRAQEQQARQDEKERKRLYIESRKQEAADLTEDVGKRIEELESVLAYGLKNPPNISFEEAKRSFVPPAFDSEGLDRPLPAPLWEDFAPPRPSLMGRLAGGARYRQELEAKRQEYEEQLAQHAAAQADRVQRLEALKRAHRQTTAVERRRYEASIDAYAAEVEAGEQEAVEEYFQDVLDDSPYPEGFVNLTRVIYLPHARDLVVEFELPSQELIPVEREYRYIQTRDEIRPIARPAKDVKELYRQLIAQVALRAIHEVFYADQFDTLDTVTFVGLVSTVDKATGHPIRPSLLSVSVDRETFSSLVLANVNPVACLTRLNALVSPHPYDLEAVAPIVDFEALLQQYRFVEGVDVLAGLDSRKDLLTLTPTEFEHFTRQLFETMGMKAWNTVASKDDGVDAVATSEIPVFGGLCVIQAKRYSGAVGVDAVKA